ncbi:hypothetical protein ACP4OV_031520 [Aristida adscensionis]
MADLPAAKLRRLEHHGGLGDALKPSSFIVEDLPSRDSNSCDVTAVTKRGCKDEHRGEKLENTLDFPL